MFELSLTIAVLGVFACVALIAGSLTYSRLEKTSPIRRRLEDLRPGPADAQSAVDLTFGRDDAPAAVRRIATFIPKSPKSMSRLQRRLATAGYYKSSHAAWYVLAEIAGVIVGFLVPLIVFGQQSGLILGLLGAIVGYLVPSFWLERKIATRKKRIQNGLPDALDLLIVCVEAGLAMDQAILKCAQELTIAHPELAEELRHVNVEIRAGKPRLEAFKNFSKRTQVDDVRALVAMLVQTDRFGTSVAQALRTHAETSRTKRRQRAEERAAKIGVKMVFPLVFCLFPALFVVALGTALIKLMEFFDNLEGAAF